MGGIIPPLPNKPSWHANRQIFTSSCQVFLNITSHQSLTKRLGCAGWGNNESEPKIIRVLFTQQVFGLLWTYKQKNTIHTNE